MDRTRIKALLATWVHEYRMSRYDAEMIFSLSLHVTDTDTFADIVDGQGYPNLAEELYALS